MFHLHSGPLQLDTGPLTVSLLLLLQKQQVSILMTLLVTQVATVDITVLHRGVVEEGQEEQTCLSRKTGLLILS